MKWRPLTGRHTNRIEALRGMAPHELLGISATASSAEIKAAFRVKAKAYHPDRLDPFLQSHAQEIMKLLNQAYQLMVTSATRR